jgi:HAE1 family hydrophobic/amphiphilic exporter-1
MLLKAPTGKKSLLTPFYNGFNKVFGVTTDAYVSFAGILIRKMFRSMAFIGVLIYVIVVLVRHIPGGFVPEEDQGYIMVNAQLPDAASLERTDAAMKKAEAIMEKNESIEGFNTISGYSLLTSAYSSNMGFFFVQLKPWEERSAPEAHAREVVTALNKAFAQEIPEGRVLAFGPPAIPGLGTGAGFTMQLQDRSGNPPQYLADQTQRFIEAARKRPEIGRIATLYRAAVPQVYADIDRSKVLKSGVQLNDVNTTLGALLGSSYVNDFNKFGRVYKVYLQAEPEFRQDPKQLGLFFVRNQSGGMVPLDTLITSGPSSGPEFTNRFNLFRSAELTGVPAAGFSSAQTLDALEATAKEVLPADMGFDWADLSYQERRAPGVAVVFALAVFLVFLVLAAQYESWAMPFSVLLGTPFAAFGAYLGLWLARTYLGESYVNNVFAQIGLIMLIGLAAKNAILIVEFAKVEHEQGKSLVDAALLAAKLRLRPILMTAFAFILGVVPLLTATGAGAEARKVMGMVVFSGMLIATILGVLLIPMLYVMVGRVIGAAPAPAPAVGAATLAPSHGQGSH